MRLRCVQLAMLGVCRVLRRRRRLLLGKLLLLRLPKVWLWRRGDLGPMWGRYRERGTGRRQEGLGGGGVGAAIYGGAVAWCCRDELFGEPPGVGSAVQVVGGARQQVGVGRWGAGRRMEGRRSGILFLLHVLRGANPTSLTKSGG